jgi:hypothetical protein
MPIVPRQERQVDLNRLPTPQLGGIPSSAPAEAFGGGQAGQALGQGLNKIADSVGRYQEQAAQKANEVWGTGADLTLSQKQSDIERAVKNMKGKDAAGALEYAKAEWEKVAEETRKSASNGLQQDAAEKLLQARWVSLKKLTNSHSDSEFNALDKLQNKEYLKATANEAMQNKDDPERVALALMNQAAEVERFGRRQGYTDAIIKQQQLEENSGTRVAVLNSILSSQDPYKDSKAKAFFEANKSGFTELDEAKASKLVEEATMTGESQRQADKIFASSGSLSAALEQTKSIQEPKLRDETTRRVKDLFGMKKQAEDDAAERNHREAVNIIDRTGNTDDIPRDKWMSFSLSQRSALQNYAEHKRKGSEPATDWNLYYSLKTMAADPRLRNEFMRIDLMQHRSKMANGEFKELVNAQEGLRKGDDKTAKLLDGVRTDQEIVNSALLEAGIDPTPKPDSDDATKVNMFRRKVDEAVIALQGRTGKAVTSKELEEIVADQMVSGITEKHRFKLFGVEQSYWPATQKRKFELMPGESLDFDYSDIPEAERKVIEKKLSDRKVKPTPERVIEIYKQKVNR